MRSSRCSVLLALALFGCAGAAPAPVAPGDVTLVEAGAAGPTPAAPAKSLEGATPSDDELTRIATGDVGGSTRRNGLGAPGSGTGGGGQGGPIRLGTIATLPYGDGPSRPRPPGIDGSPVASGGLPVESVESVVRGHFNELMRCYEQGSSSNPTLQNKGHVLHVRFVIGASGVVVGVPRAASGTLADESVLLCVVSAFRGFVFPSPSGGVVMVDYPLTFSPGGSGPAPPARSPAPPLTLALPEAHPPLAGTSP